MSATSSNIHKCYTNVTMIAKFRTFIRTYIKTITEPGYYRHILKANFSFSVKYFLCFYFLISLISTLDYTLNLKPQIADFSQNAIHELTTNYPPDLVLNLSSQGLVVEGASEPIQVPFPQFLSEPQLTQDYEYFIHIDSQTEFPRSKALITLAQNDLIVRQPDGTKQSLPYSEIEGDITINKAAISLFTSSLQSTLDTLIKYSPLIFGVATLILMPTIAALTLVFFSLFIWLSLNFSQRRFTYKKSYQIGLHLITFAETVILIQSLLFPSIHFPQLFSIAFFGSVILVIWAIRPQTSN